MLKPEDAKTLPELIRSTAAAFGDNVAIRLAGDEGAGGSVSFREIDARSSQIARGLLAQGIGKGARVGFIFGNAPEFLVIFAAVARIGAVAIPISTMIRANELVRVLRQSDVSGLIVQREYLGHDYVQRLLDALPGLAQAARGHIALPEVPYLRWIVSTGPDLPAPLDDIAGLAEAGASIGEDLLAAVEAEVHPTDQIVEIYTSGSMALPKGVRHNHGAVMFRCHYLRSMLNIERGAQVTAQLPFFWVGGLMMYLLPSWEAGATVVCPQRTLNNSRVAMGSVLTDDDVKALARQPKPWWGLGMSETLGPYSYADDFRAPGYPLCAPMDHFADGYEIRLADAEDRPVADGEVGEMQIRGYPVSPGLHKMERAAYFTADGYYRTGDLCLREGSRVHFVGRSGDMINAAGSNVSPAEVEMELQALDGVQAAYVVGLPDKERGQLVAAAVVAEDVRDLDFQWLEGELRKKLSPYKVPRGWVQITRDEVPLLHSNKVSRRQIEQLLAERLARG
ncbi:MAG: hypothetical protein CMH85_17430 [Novosphingobium sp.]|nr:hypothetical protein [Novosphingobium sp.]